MAWKKNTTDEHVVYDDKTYQVVKAKAVQNLPETQAWDAEAVKNVRKSPWNEQEGEEQDMEEKTACHSSENTCGSATPGRPQSPKKREGDEETPE